MFGVRKASKEFAVALREILDENSRLKAENAKLRDFARSAWQVLTHNEPLFVWKDMEADARELGIDGVIEGLDMVVDFGDAKDKPNEAIARQTINIDSSIREMRMLIADGICNIGREC